MSSEAIKEKNNKCDYFFFLSQCDKTKSHKQSQRKKSQTGKTFATYDEQRTVSKYHSNQL